MYMTRIIIFILVVLVLALHPCEAKELDGRVVSALGVRSRKLSTGLNGQS
jgi:hypothetical protein